MIGDEVTSIVSEFALRDDLFAIRQFVVASILEAWAFSNESAIAESDIFRRRWCSEWTCAGNGRYRRDCQRPTFGRSRRLRRATYCANSRSKSAHNA